MQVWVDSDGKNAYNGPRMAGLSDPKSSSSAGGTPTSASALLDRQWHMLTVSTQPDHTKGYRWGALCPFRESDLQRTLNMQPAGKVLSCISAVNTGYALHVDEVCLCNGLCKVCMVHIQALV